MVASTEGGGVGEADRPFCQLSSPPLFTLSASVTTPTRCMRPLGASVPIRASQFSAAPTVMSTKSRLPAAAFSSALSTLDSVLCAPKASASSRLEGDEVKAVTSQPQARANLTARCPRPPMPTTPTRSVGLIACSTKGRKTVPPPHISGPAAAGSSASGSGTAQLQCARSRSAKPPWRPISVGWRWPHRCCSPPRQKLQWVQLPLCQPTPTRWPIWRPLACGPRAVMRPTTSWPGTTG